MKLQPAHTIGTHKNTKRSWHILYFFRVCNKMQTLGYLINKWGTFACDVIELVHSLCQLHIFWFVLVCLIQFYLICANVHCRCMHASNWAALNWIELNWICVCVRTNDNFVTLRIYDTLEKIKPLYCSYIVDAVCSCHRHCAQCYLQHTFAVVAFEAHLNARVWLYVARFVCV